MSQLEPVMTPAVPSTRQPPPNKSKAAGTKRARATSIATDSASRTAGQDKEKNQDRINRKRVQNRISQQCVREKQLAHQKRLEALAEIIRTSTEADSTSTESKNALLNNQMSLIEENRDLRDALLRMRKKMLSLSSAVAAVADDPIFEQILQKPKRKKDKDSQAEPDSSAQPGIKAIPSTETPLPCLQDESNSVSIENTRKPHDLSAMDFDGMQMSDFNSMNENNRLSPASSNSTQSIHTSEDVQAGLFDSSMTQPKTFEYTMGDMIDQNMLLMDEISHAVPSQHQATWNPYQPDMMTQARFVQSETIDFPHFTVVGENSWKIEQASLWYLAERFGVHDHAIGTHQAARSCYDTARLSISRLHRECDRTIISDVAKMAVNVMCRASGFTEYIYGVGANVPMEQVFQWRLSPSTHTRFAIMEPFRPTPLQNMTTDYPIAIDMVNWPTIRDQLIFKLGSYDFDQVIADIVANTVIELPEVRAAINIHDTFFTRVWSKAAASYTAGHFGRPIQEGGFGEWESRTPGQATVGWTSNDVFRFITQRMQLLSDSRTMDSRLSADSWQGVQAGMLEKRLTVARTAPKQPLATKWGLDGLSRWKLSREFAAAYPFLDCSGVTASFPLYSSKMVPDGIVA